MSFTKVQLIEWGIFEMLSFKKLFADGSSTGYDYVECELSLLKSTFKIPLKANVCFGLKYKLLDFNKSEFICRVIHPEIKNPERLSFTQTLFKKTLSPGAIYNDFILFEYSWQMIPGYWTFQICDHFEIFFEKEFEIFIENSLEATEDEDYFYDL